MPDALVLPLCQLLAELWEIFLDGGDLEREQLQAMLVRTGLAEWTEATEADVSRWNGDIEVGDPLLTLTEIGKQFARAGKL